MEGSTWAQFSTKGRVQLRELQARIRKVRLETTGVSSMAREEPIQKAQACSAKHYRSTNRAHLMGENVSRRINSSQGKSEALCGIQCQQDTTLFCITGHATNEVPRIVRLLTCNDIFLTCLSVGVLDKLRAWLLKSRHSTRPLSLSWRPGLISTSHVLKICGKCGPPYHGT
jgi:hypothetical protein